MPFDAADDDDIIQALIKARALIDRPEKWCKGIPYQYRHGEVAARCAQSALAEASTNRSKHAVRQFMTDYVLRARGVVSIPNFNDLPRTSHYDVLALFDGAIAYRRQELGMR